MFRTTVRFLSVPIGIWIAAGSTIGILHLEFDFTFQNQKFGTCLCGGLSFKVGSDRRMKPSCNSILYEIFAATCPCLYEIPLNFLFLMPD